MSFQSYIHSIKFQTMLRTMLASVLIALGLIQVQRVSDEKKPSFRTYYVQDDGKICARKPSKYAQTVRAQNITHARKLLAV